MNPFPEPLESDLTDLSTNDFIVELQHMADKLEPHPAFQGYLAEYLSPAPKLRKMSDDIAKARDAAAGHDVNMVAVLNALRLAAQQAIILNARHISALAWVRKDPSLLLNSGYDPKERHYNKSLIVNLLDLEPEIIAKHGGLSGYVVVTIKRAKNGAVVEVQMTSKNPADEASWDGIGIHTKSRIDLKGKEPASKLYFRARYHEAGSTGAWSTPVGIIVL